MALHRRRHRQGADDNAERSTVSRLEDSGDTVASSSTAIMASSPSKNKNVPIAKAKDTSTSTTKQSFHVTKFVILRLVGFVYFIAFLGAYYQNQGLMGSKGLVPAYKYMENLQSNYVDTTHGFLAHPTLYWFITSTSSTLQDWHLDMTAGCGIVLSLLVIFGVDSFCIMILLWIFDFSIVTVAGGNSFYSYGWESQLLETGFLAIWLCDIPVIQSQRSSSTSLAEPPSLPVLWLFRWLCFRISTGAGLIKLRGGECWKNKTCLYYHFETQPIPSPMSFLFHFLPKSVLRRAVDLDFFVQLYSIWLVLLPGNAWYLTSLRRLGGFIQAGFMMNIILSGNFAFLNHVTIIPALACLDDACFPRWLKNYVYQRHQKIRSGGHSEVSTIRRQLRVFIDICLVTLIGYLSVPVVANLLQMGGNRQAMNASFNSFRLVNTYGAFGSVGERRYEPIISVSSNGQNWTEIELPCKPGNVNRRPCFCAPYHYRLDWNIWFIGFKPHQSMLQRRESWMFELMRLLVTSDDSGKNNATNSNERRPWLALLDPSSVSYLHQQPSKYAKVDMYQYKMAGPLWSILSEWIRGKEVTWWEREFEEVLIRPLKVQDDGSLAYATVYDLYGNHNG